MDDICELRDVSKRFGDREVLRNVSLKVRRGEFMALTGRSGSGKSTILNILGLLDVATSGEVNLFGKRAPRLNSRRGVEVLRHGLGYLFQNAALVDSDTVGQNLSVAQTYVSGSSTVKREQAATALSIVGLRGTERRRVYSLSGGEQQRLALARLMIKPCELVLADEPTGSLDTYNRDMVIEHLRFLNSQGKSIVVVTHDPAMAAAADRQMVIGSGTLRAG